MDLALSITTMGRKMKLVSASFAIRVILSAFVHNAGE